MTPTTQSRSPRRNREEWAQLLRAYEESDLDQRQFCQHHGLGYSTFGKWKKRLSASTPFPEGDLIELTSTVTKPSSPWEVELTLGSGMVLRIRRR
jgi:hypothetical protein